MDAELRELERRVASEPRDLVLLEELVRALVRAGRQRDAQRRVARAFAAPTSGAGGAALLDVFKAAGAPLRAVPSRDRHALVAVMDDVVYAVGDLPFLATSRVALAGDFVAGDSEGIDVYRLEKGLPRVAGAPFEVPTGAPFFRSITLVGRAVHVAVASAKHHDRLAVRDLDAPEEPWRIVELHGRTGSVTAADLVLVPVSRDRLVAIDRTASRPASFLLDTRDPLSPRVERSVALPRHHAREHLVAASSDGSWIALLSWAPVTRGPVAFVSLLEVRTLHEFVRFALPAAPAARPRPANDVLVAGGRLHVALGARGVLSSGLSPLPTDGSPFMTDGPVVPPLEEGEEVVRLTPLDAHRAIATVARDTRSARSVVVSLDPAS
ncbi:MAG TPA: hypothetical protein VFF73_35470 [Planctomycetota bacterium]|nr:hypothetical protein [Planctomycetota bacterium]